MKNKLKQTLALTLVLIMSLTSIVNAQTFTDVPKAHWGYEAIEDMVAKGYLNGMGDGTFAPDKAVTYAEFVKMMQNILIDESTLDNYASQENGDRTPNNKWYASVMRFAGAKGWLDSTSGYNTYGFNGLNYELIADKTISRYDMSRILWQIAHTEFLLKNDEKNERILGYISNCQNMAKTLQDYTLSSDPNYAQLNSNVNIGDFNTIRNNYIDYAKTVAFVTATGLIKGVDSEGTFDGNAPVTRAAAATIMGRLLQKIDGTLPETAIASFNDNEKPDEPEQDEYIEDERFDKWVLDAIDLVNEEREKLGVAPLEYDPSLQDYATLRAEESIVKFDHERPNGERSTDYGYAEVSILTRGRICTAEEAVKKWKTSPTHWKILTSDKYKYVSFGIGAKSNPVKSTWIGILKK